MLTQPSMECGCQVSSPSPEYIEQHMKSGLPFSEFVLRSSNPSATLEVSGPTTDMIVNPLVIIRNGRVTDFAGRIDPNGEPRIEMLSADDATVQAYIGRRVLAPKRIKPEIVERTIRAVKDSGVGAVGFTDGHTGYGIVP